MTTRFLLAVLCTFAVALTATGTRVRRLSLTELRESAASVLVVDALETSVRAGKAGMVWTEYRVRIVEVLDGAGRAGDVVILPFAGGRIGTREAGIAGVPQLAIGSRYVMFVDDAPGRPVPAVGWGQGVFALRDGELVSLAGDRLVIDREGRLDRRPVRPEIVRGLASRRRLADPSAFNGDGSPAEVERPALAGSAERDRVATLEDLRKFVRRSLGDPSTERQR